MSAKVIKKSTKVTKEQKKVLTDFMMAHPELVKSKHTGSFTNAKMQNLWGEVTAQLNAMDGPSKEWKIWRRVSTSWCIFFTHYFYI